MNIHIYKHFETTKIISLGFISIHEIMGAGEMAYWLRTTG